MSSHSQTSYWGPLPRGWALKKLEGVLQREVRPLVPDPNSNYREIGVRSHGKGIFHKEPIDGASLGDKRVFWTVPHCIVFNIVFAWEGAVALTSESERGMIASHRFPMYSAVPGQSDIQFVRRLFQSEQGVRLLAEASPGGAGRNRTLNQGQIAAITLPIPPLAEQRKIASILSSVDEAIEATQAVVDQLAVVKKAMMADLITRGIPGRHTRFKKTEIGEVPEEWEVVQLGSVLSEGPSNGIYKPAHLIGRGVLLVGMKALSERSIVWSESRRAEVELQELERFGLQCGDILVTRVYARIDGIGRFIAVSAPPEEAVFESNMMRLRVDRARVLPEFVALHMELVELRREIEQRATLGAQASINNAAVRTLLLRLPSLEEQTQISNAVLSVSHRECSEHESLTALREVKSALMSTLLSGEVRVRVEGEAP